MEVLTALAAEIERGDDEKAAELTRGAIAQNLAPGDILNQGLIAGMNVVGEKFRTREIFLPDVLLAAKAMYAGMDLLKPLLVKDGVPTRGRVVLGTVQGDLHDIGKQLVGIMLRGAGFEVIDLGHDVAPARFVAAVKEFRPAVLGLSTLLTTTMPVMRKVVALLKEEGLAGQVKTIVGGAPVSAEFAREIGADAYGYDAANAVERVMALVP